ncbi:MAG TPA: hypothetical protein VGG05_24580 [Pseudonocardiaceae bacterium]
MASTPTPATPDQVRTPSQPAAGSWMMVYTNANRVAVPVTAPARSKDRAPPAGRPAGNSTGASSDTTTPIGTLIQKIHCQPSVSVNTPPSSSPAVAPTPPRPPQIPNARLRS